MHLHTYMHLHTSFFMSVFVSVLDRDRSNGYAIISIVASKTADMLRRDSQKYVKSQPIFAPSLCMFDSDEINDLLFHVSCLA